MMRKVEARDGIEPPNKGFADLSLTVWVPRRLEKQPLQKERLHFEPNPASDILPGLNRHSYGVENRKLTKISHLPPPYRGVVAHASG
jgi:hypothetical protein